VPPAACAAAPGTLHVPANDTEAEGLLAGTWIVCENEQFFDDLVGFTLRPDLSWNGLHLVNGTIVEEKGFDQGIDWNVSSQGFLLTLNGATQGFQAPLTILEEPPRFRVGPYDGYCFPTVDFVPFTPPPANR
jgi:hypothetical protein